jgi:hypothetical protein
VFTLCQMIRGSDVDASGSNLFAMLCISSGQATGKRRASDGQATDARQDSGQHAGMIRGDVPS